MELGATICVPRDPPLRRVSRSAAHCAAYRAGTQNDIPLKRAKPAPEQLERTLLVIRRNGSILLTPSPRVKGFWDLPEHFPQARAGATLGEFRHTITHRHYRFTVKEATTRTTPRRSRWHTMKELATNPPKHHRQESPADIQCPVGGTHAQPHPQRIRNRHAVPNRNRRRQAN